MIAVNDLVKNHGTTRILDGVSLAVERGEVATIIGPSGGGKSTLLRCINALEPFQGGSIKVEDRQLFPEGPARIDPTMLRQLRQRVGMVFQQFNLFPHLTALENVMSGPRYAQGKSRGEVEANAMELLRRVGLESRSHARPEKLSGGQQQRVAIARALAVNPAAILFDEPTSSLDPRMADEVMGVITDLARGGQTMIVVTHVMAFARRVSKNVHVMSAGKIVESGPPERIFGSATHATTREFLQQAEQ